MTLKFTLKNILISIFILSSASAWGYEFEPIKYGDMNSWVCREIKESAIIGGHTRNVYAIGPTQTITGNKTYRNLGGSPWGSSNIMAKVCGIVKTSNSVTPMARPGQGNCAKLSTLLEHVKAIGIINMDVLVSGSIFLGEMMEPITSTNSPYSKMEMGIPYTRRPDYLVFDYKLYNPGTKMIKSSGFGSKKTLTTTDNAEVFALLQKRWEDADGNLHALRVGTARERFSKTTPEWINAHKSPIYYGDITKKPFYKSYMGLLNGNRAYYARNSKGKMVPVEEEGWAPENTTPTHVLLMASSGCGTAYEGTVGMEFLIDNIGFGFE